MKRTIFALLVVIAAASWLGFYTLNHVQNLKQSPFTDSVAYDNIARITTDPTGGYLIIHKSKQELAKILPSGLLDYQLLAPERKDDALKNYTNMTVDPQGNVYVLFTELDEFGLYVKGEQIVRYTSSGVLDKVIQSYTYDVEKDRMLRIGKVKALQYQQNQLYYYTVNEQQARLNQYNPSNNKLSSILEVDISNNSHISEIIGTELGHIYYSTKKGEIYRIHADGQSNLLLDSSNSGSKLMFPTNLRLNNNGQLYFLDMQTEVIYRLLHPELNEIGISAFEQVDLYKASKTEKISGISSLIPNEDGSLFVSTSDTVYHYDKAGRWISSLSKADYPKNILFTNWLIWLAGLATVILILVAFWMIYDSLMKRRISIILKQIMVFVPIIIISMVVLSYIIFTSFSVKMKLEVEKQLQLLAHNGQSLISGEQLELIQSPADYMSDAYVDIKRNKDSLFTPSGNESYDREGLYSTLYKVQDHVLYVIMDDDNGINLFRPFESSEENENVIKNKAVSSGEFEDANGTWIYAIGPVMNAADEVVGIYEVGKEMHSFETHQRELLNSVVESIIIISCMIVIVFLIMTFYLLNSIRMLRSSVNEMASGKWDTVVEIKTKDEVSDLGDRFNFMSKQIRDYVSEVTELSESYFRFVPQQFMNFLGKDSILDVKLGDQVQRDMIILVCNIRDFYAMSKNMTPEENFNFINSFLKRIGPPIRANGGIVNKYLGAGVLALFPDNSDEALLAAIGIREELLDYNNYRRNSNYKTIELGISLHKGPLMLGIIGEEQRIDGGVLSDHVNLTTILEKMTEDLGASILITEDLRIQLHQSAHIEYRNLGLVEVQGYDQPLLLYDVFHGDVETIRKLKSKTKAKFEEGIELYQAGRFFDARENFLQVIKLNRQDKAAKHYFYICDEYYQKGTEVNWKGTLTITV
ncbi:MAG: adenylate/guanylate cyclase domain-containing protein [Paenibacillaceae bacterium]